MDVLSFLFGMVASVFCCGGPIGAAATVILIALLTDHEWLLLTQSLDAITELFRPTLWRMGVDWANRPANTAEAFMAVLGKELEESQQSSQPESSEQPDGSPSANWQDVSAQSMPASQDTSDSEESS